MNTELRLKLQEEIQYYKGAIKENISIVRGICDEIEKRLRREKCGLKSSGEFQGIHNRIECNIISLATLERILNENIKGDKNE